LAEITSDRKSFFSAIRGKKTESGAEMSFFDHIEELRWHLVRSVIVFVCCAAVIFIYKDWVYDHIILAPAQQGFVTYSALCRFGHWLHLGDAFCMPPVQINLQVNTVNGTFTSALSIATIGGLILSFPFIVWEIWKFIKPALSAKEIRNARGGIFWVSFFFFCGASFGYYLLAPFTYNFLATFTLGTTGMTKYYPSITDYIDSLTSVVLGCGLGFEMPIIAYVLANIGIINGAFLKRYFKFAFVIILVVAGIITPSPDWMTQLFVAIPLTILYLVSIVLANRVEKRKDKVEKEWS
jgi:sec-independent protein translocase protein TatC